MAEKNKNLWQEVDADIAEKTSCGYKMAILDSDKLLRRSLKEKGYPSKDLKKQLFWAGININSRPDFQNALKKKDEILNDFDYRLSSFELDDFLDAYKRAIDEVILSEKLSFRRRVGIYLENYLFLKDVSKWKAIVAVLAVFLGIKFLSSTMTGNNVVKKVVEADDFLFNWFIVLLLIGLGATLVVSLSFVYFDKKKKVKIKED